MRGITLAVPLRRSRRERRRPGGPRTDMRATLRQARRTGGHAFALIGRAPARRPRRMVVLCDISGSMEPYARAMIQLLYCAAGGARAEVFSFATRLTRLTPALSRSLPGPALERAGQAAPDWLGGTKIGEALREFNDSYGRRGMARGAVVLIVSDGWDTGDPDLVRREMERLSLVAYRIVWVNPRTKSAGYQPLAGGMAAAWPHCDAVVSAHTVQALDQLTAALADPVRRRVPVRPSPVSVRRPRLAARRLARSPAPTRRSDRQPDGPQVTLARQHQPAARLTLERDGVSELISGAGQLDSMRMVGQPAALVLAALALDLDAAQHAGAADPQHRRVRPRSTPRCRWRSRGRPGSTTPSR